MIVKGIVFEDIVNYKKTSMTIMFPKCSFKCGCDICQNGGLVNEKDIDVSVDSVVNRYVNNPLTHAIVLQGLEPFDSYQDMIDLINTLRNSYQCHDEVVIYTGYDEQEIEEQIRYITNNYDNIIVKYGRFIPNQKNHYDEILGVNLASDNQYAKKIS